MISVIMLCFNDYYFYDNDNDISGDFMISITCG